MYTIYIYFFFFYDHLKYFNPFPQRHTGTLSVRVCIIQQHIHRKPFWESDDLSSLYKIQTIIINHRGAPYTTSTGLPGDLFSQNSTRYSRNRRRRCTVGFFHILSLYIFTFFSPLTRGRYADGNNNYNNN